MAVPIRHAATALALCLLAACTAAQVETTRIRSAAQDTITATLDCLEGVANNPDRKDIMAKVYAGREEQVPAAMLLDQRRPTPDEIQQIYLLHGDIQTCRKVTLDGAAKVHPLAVMALVESYAATDKAFAGLVSGLVTYGQFNQYQKDIFAASAIRGQQVAAQINAQLNNQHQFELQQRAAAANAFAAWNAQQQRLLAQQRNVNALYRRRPIDCRYVADRLVCVYL